MAAEGLGGVQERMANFHREVERDVTITAQNSLFTVIVRPSETIADHPVTAARYRRVADAVLVADEHSCRGVKDVDFTTAETVERQSTGFVVAAHGTTLRVLTTAHVISDIYTARIYNTIRGEEESGHNQFTLQQVNRLFDFSVWCYHHEVNVRTRQSNQPISERERVPAEATVIALDTEKDLLVLEFSSRELCESDEGDERTFCPHANHPVIERAAADPNQMQKLVLAGWPPQRAGSCSKGQVSFCQWTYDAITSLNFKGYNMNLLEIPGMAADSGFSGAPVLNGAGQYVGVYHGVFNLNNGYAIHGEDVRNFLEQHHVMVWGPQYDVILEEA